MAELSKTADVCFLSFMGVVLQGVEAERQEFVERHGPDAVAGWEDDGGVGRGEFGEHLAACAAGRAWCVVEIGDGGGGDADGGAVLADGTDKGGAFGADGEAEADVFDVGAGDGAAVGEQECGTDFEAGVGGVGVLGGLSRLLE